VPWAIWTGAPLLAAFIAVHFISSLYLFLLTILAAAALTQWLALRYVPLVPRKSPDAAQERYLTNEPAALEEAGLGSRSADQGAFVEHLQGARRRSCSASSTPTEDVEAAQPGGARHDPPTSRGNGRRDGRRPRGARHRATNWPHLLAKLPPEDERSGMGVRTRGLDIKAGAKRDAADKAARGG
jgi:hypothetical protein